MTTITVIATKGETTRSFTLYENSIIGFEMDHHDAYVWVTLYDTRKDAENALQLHARDFDEKGWILDDRPLPIRDLGPADTAILNDLVAQGPSAALDHDTQALLAGLW